MKSYFNSQPHEEADGSLLGVDTKIGNFNSQPHEEADGETLRVPAEVYEFQLTASRRG